MGQRRLLSGSFLARSRHCTRYRQAWSLEGSAIRAAGTRVGLAGLHEAGDRQRGARACVRALAAPGEEWMGGGRCWTAAVCRGSGPFRVFYLGWAWGLVRWRAAGFNAKGAEFRFALTGLEFWRSRLSGGWGLVIAWPGECLFALLVAWRIGRRDRFYRGRCWRFCNAAVCCSMDGRRW